jgi:hypothetical protein
MRHFKFKVDIYEGPENMFNYTKKGEFFAEDDKTEDELKVMVEEKLLNSYEKENMISEIILKQTPII